MYESEIIEYTNRHKMEETTAKVFARLHQMKSILYKTIRSKYIYQNKSFGFNTKIITRCKSVLKYRRT